MQNLEIKCYEGEHVYWALLGGGLGVLSWVVGIPWVGWAILRERRSQLQNKNML